MINWNAVIDNLKDGSIVTVDSARWEMSNPEYKEMLDLWKSKNFNTSSVRWTNFYDTKKQETILSENLNVTPLRSWISCVEPGYMTGYHYDIDDNEKEYLRHGAIKRYSVFMNNPCVGQMFILGKEYIHSSPQGTVLKWGNYREWHNGINGGFENKYMFHLLSY
jgi:hypothetical protein